MDFSFQKYKPEELLGRKVLRNAGRAYPGVNITEHIITIVNKKSFKISGCDKKYRLIDGLVVGFEKLPSGSVNYCKLKFNDR